jgi:hypothetical protein
MQREMYVRRIQSWNPLTGEDLLATGQKVGMDPAAYKMHALNADWPLLTFDFLCDDLGDPENRSMRPPRHADGRITVEQYVSTISAHDVEHRGLYFKEYKPRILMI